MTRPPVRRSRWLAQPSPIDPGQGRQQGADLVAGPEHSPGQQRDGGPVQQRSWSLGHRQKHRQHDEEHQAGGLRPPVGPAGAREAIDVVRHPARQHVRTDCHRADRQHRHQHDECRRTRQLQAGVQPDPRRFIEPVVAGEPQVGGDQQRGPLGQVERSRQMRPAQHDHAGQPRRRGPDPRPPGRGCNHPGVERVAQLRFAFVQRGDAIVVDVAALVDRPERQQQQRQAHHVMPRCARQRDRAQHPVGKIVLQDRAPDVMLAGPLDMSQVFAGQVNPGQSTTEAGLRPAGMKRPGAHGQQWQVVGGRIGHHQRAAHHLGADFLVDHRQLAAAPIGEAVAMHRHQRQAAEAHRLHQRFDDRPEPERGDHRSQAARRQRPLQRPVGVVARKCADTPAPRRRAPRQHGLDQLHAPGVARFDAAAPAPRLDELDQAHQHDREQARARRIDEILGRVAQVQRLVEVDQHRPVPRRQRRQHLRRGRIANRGRGRRSGSGRNGGFRRGHHP